MNTSQGKDMVRINVMLGREEAAECSLLLNSSRRGELIGLTVIAVLSVSCLSEHKAGNGQG